MGEKSIEIIVPAEKLAAAVNKWLIPGFLRRHAAQQQKENPKDVVNK